LENHLVPELEAELKEASDDEMVTSVSDTIPNYEERIRPIESQLDTANRQNEEALANPHSAEMNKVSTPTSEGHKGQTTKRDYILSLSSRLN